MPTTTEQRAAADALWTEYIDSGRSVEVRNKLVEQYMKLVHRNAQKWRGLINVRLDYEDIVSEAVIGLIRAIETFDPSKGFTFMTYAMSVIPHTLMRAADVDADVNRVQQKAGVRVPYHVSLDAPIGEDDGGTVGDIIPERHDAYAEVLEAMEQAETRERVQSALAQLADERDRQVLTMRLMEGKRLEAIGEVLGVSRERVRQLQVRAEANLRAVLEGRPQLKLQTPRPRALGHRNGAVTIVRPRDPVPVVGGVVAPEPPVKPLYTLPEATDPPAIVYRAPVVPPAPYDEQTMVAILRARGYVVFTPQQLRENSSRVGREQAERRRADGTLHDFMAHVRSHRKPGSTLKPEPPHGTAERYWSKRYRCHCVPCKLAMNEYLAKHPNAQVRARRAEQAARASRPVTCKGCSQSFTLGAGDPRRVYCTKECKAKAAYRRHKAASTQFAIAS